MDRRRRYPTLAAGLKLSSPNNHATDYDQEPYDCGDDFEFVEHRGIALGRAVESESECRADVGRGLSRP